jgi:hypothetical protein
MSEVCRVPGCETAGSYRVSSRDDPWPLRYACATHLAIVCTSMGERTGVDYIRPGQITPPPRETGVGNVTVTHLGPKDPASNDLH